MDVLMFTVTICFFVMASIYIWKIINWIYLRPKHLEKLLRQQGFKGNSYKLLFGDSKEMGKGIDEVTSKPMDFSNDIVHRATPFFHNACKNYGDNNIIWLGPTPTISITDQEIIKEILSKNYVFPRGADGNPLFGSLVRGIVTYETEKWAKHRRLLNPAFHLEKLKHMVPSFYLSCSEMLSKWDDEILAAKQGWCEVDVWPHIVALTSDVISRTAFGSCYEEGRKIFRLQTKQAKRIAKATQAVYIPGSRFLPTKFNRKIKENAREIKESLKGIIDKRMKAMEAGESNVDDDLLGILLHSNLNEIMQRGSDFGMTMDEVIEECKLFYLAGQETTSSLLVWTMILLSQHEDWQARAREEVLQVFGERKLEYQELNHLKIVSMILHETLRLYPPVFEIFRATHKEARFGKLRIPAGVKLMIPVLSLHHDPRIWGDDAGRFNPERFSEGVSNATGGRMAYFPFGWGPRTCIGQNFSMLEAKITMAMILQHYSFKLSPSYTHAPRTIMTLQPQHGAHLLLTKL